MKFFVLFGEKLYQILHFELHLGAQGFRLGYQRHLDNKGVFKILLNIYDGASLRK